MKFIRDFKTKEAYTNFKASSKRKTLTSHPESDTEEQVNLQGTDYEIYYKTSDNQSITLGTDEGFGATVESNEYPKYSGTVSFDNKPTTIPASSFSSQDTLTSVELPNSITTIESGSFSNSSNLNNVTINSETVSVAENSFNGVADTGKLTISNEELLDDVTFNNEFIGWNAYKSNGTFIETIQEKEIDYSQIPMFFENVGENVVNISVQLMSGSYTSYTATLETSTDGSTWTTWGSTSTTAIAKSVPVGGKLYIRATSDVGYFNINSNYNYFSSTGKVNVGGNIMSLGYKNFEDKTSITQNYAYNNLFNNMSKLVDAHKLLLPATTLAECCYNGMFNGCTSLTTAPKLPATTLASNCYSYMFQGCTSLTTAPELPATTLVLSCYFYMFKGCTSLTTAPELLSTTLAPNCYNSMFKDCTSLTTAPELPATTLESYCYQSMFWGCTSLTTAPELQATALNFCCYDFMFAGCTGLTTAPELPATTLASKCYNGMFNGCTSLTTAPATLPATTLASSCYSAMFNGCTSLTTAPATLPATTLASSCYSAMFQGCTSLTTAPELPATTLASNCYYEMFKGCTGLTTAPELPATTLETNCYYYMFSGCSNLNYIKALFTTTPSTSYTYNWVSGVASTGTFVKNCVAEWDVTGVNGIPRGWTIQYNGAIDSIELVDETEIPETLYANQTTVAATVKVNYTEEDGVTTGSFTKVMTSNDFGENTTGSDRQVEVTFEFKGYTTSVERTQTTEIDYQFYPMYFENVDESEITISVQKSAYQAYTATLETSTDGKTWTTWGTTSETAKTKSVSVNGKLYIRATNDVGYINNSSYYYNYFSSTGKVNVGGNIMSLGYKNFEDKTNISKSYAYYFTFYRMSKLVDASNLVLPATTLAEYCYQYMFNGCTSLTTAPATLPATTLASSCYYAMFDGCTGLTTAPELPATTLASNCYNDMFHNCTSLTTAPELPATTLASSCYNYMFQGCSSLNYIKALFTTTPSTTYTTSWVSGVASTGTFVKNVDANWDVTGVNGIPSGWNIDYNVTIDSIELVDETEIPETLYANQTTVAATVKVNYTREDGVTTGSFTKVIASNDFGENTTGSDRQVEVTFEFKGYTTSVERTQTGEYNYTNIPLFFENVDESENTISLNRYYSQNALTMEISTDGSTWETWGTTTDQKSSLTKSVPSGGKLYVRNTNTSGYFNTSGNGYHNFSSTGKVNVGGNIMSLSIKNFEGKSVSMTYEFKYTFINMSKLVDASNLVLPGTIVPAYCYQAMFNGCTGLTTAPELPATTLASSCYSSMFNGCTSLTTAPELPATTLASNCYYYMFSGCSNLNYIKAMFTTEPSTSYTNNWVSGVASTGTFVKNIDATWDVTGTYGVPSGWNIDYNVTIDSIDLVNETEIPATLYANQTTVAATVKVNYTREDGITTGSFTKVMTSNGFGINTTGSDKQVTVTFEYSEKTTSVERTQTTEINVNYTPMYFENVDESEITISVQKNNSAYTATLETSTDGSTWETWCTTSTTAKTKSVSVGCKLYIRATSDVGYFNNTYYYNYFSSTGKVNVGGNIMSLGYKNFEDKTSITQGYAYGDVFYNMTTLVDASRLVLPATTLATNCYSSMFNGCTSLTTAPELPATTLASNCYSSMFYGCTSLTTAPELPATKLAYYCYGNMFQNCSSLNYIKALFTTTPSTTYTNNWVSGVASTGTFVKNIDVTWDVTGTYGVPSGWNVVYNGTVDNIVLVDDTEIPATLYANQTTVAATVKVNYTEEDGVTTGSFTKVIASNDFGENTSGSDKQVTITFEYSEKTTSVTRTQTGEYNYTVSPIFFENADTTDITIGVAKNGYQAYAATLETSTDGSTWETWCTTSTTRTYKSVPVGCKLYIRATSDVGYFNNTYYYNYFSSTGKVNVGGNIMSLGYKNFEDKTSITQGYAYGDVFYNMTTLVDASKLVLPATTLVSQCYYYMFNGCTSLTTAPELPATKLAYYCYSSMFNGCTSLTTTPVLPVTTLAEGCYCHMFQGCTSLATAPELPATTLTSNCYYEMFKGCSNLNYIKAMFTTEPSTSYTNNWVSGVASTGTFVKNVDATWSVTGTYGVPSGWTVETASE